jgi:hypothetical protein
MNITTQSATQLNWTPEMVRDLEQSTWQAVSTKEIEPIKLELLIAEVEDVLEQKLVSGNEVLVWQERLVELYNQHQIALAARFACRA